ncbi:MAG: ATP synthase F1 subunit gamma [Candidatus Tisiphia sp.]|uniref:ATP synthase F1 subunit gamma n=1 Tax=Candidatus Tisiphia endosymbiont of Melanophora roralis TaxID=3066261 RepID=UPI001E78BE97|nr:MAG: ATP synthase F1 subunit gamma [Rickettsia endosymbiont of Cimex lectularius]
MSGLKQLRSRIKSITTTQKITKAMQIVSATKFTKAKNQVKDSEDYMGILQGIMSSVASSNNLQDMPIEQKKFFSEGLLDQGDLNINKSHLLIVVTSERGLCGAFNFLLSKQVKSDIANLENAGKQVRLIIIGKKGYDAFKGQYSHYIDDYYEFPKAHNNNLSFQIKEKLMEMVEDSRISNCQIYFNNCKNAMIQIPIKKQILPVEKQLCSNEKYLSYEYEGEGLILHMINLYVSAQINYALLQNRASEEGARMTAMDNATKNAKELINKLTLKLNRSRQDMITKDLIEIIAGAEAV